MSGWTAAATLVLFSPPSATDARVVPAVGPQGIFSAEEFSKLWLSFFGESASPAMNPSAAALKPTTATLRATPSPVSQARSLCGGVKEIGQSDAHWIARDGFLVHLRGFRSSVCEPKSWFVASMRLDPCRVRLNKENKTKSEVQRCAQAGKFSEVRVVLQPVEQTDRDPIFPDAALHVAFSIPDFSTFADRWRKESPQALLTQIKQKGRLNDVSLFLGGAGLERWTFARIVPEGARWRLDRLPHGGFFESISDADVSGTVVKTPRPVGERALSTDELHDPLKIHPLQGSCIECHLADKQRPVRQFRQLGWGLQGESVISRRVLAEAEFAARELNVLSQPAKAP